MVGKPRNSKCGNRHDNIPCLLKIVMQCAVVLFFFCCLCLTTFSSFSLLNLAGVGSTTSSNRAELSNRGTTAFF